MSELDLRANAGKKNGKENDKHPVWPRENQNKRNELAVSKGHRFDPRLHETKSFFISLNLTAIADVCDFLSRFQC